MIRKIFDEIGPVLAGFQIAVSIVGFFGIGAVAKWILQNWLPFTRWVWDELFLMLSLPDLSIGEKDSLTTLAFFLPMAISSAYTWWDGRELSEVLPQDNEAASKEIRYRIYASLIGAVFMIVVGGSVIDDAFTLFEAAGEGINESADDTSINLDIKFFANFGLATAVLALIVVVAALLYWLSRRNTKISELIDKALSSISNRGKPILKDMASKAVVSTMGGVVSMLSSLLSFGAMFGGVVAAAGQLGVIRTASPILVLISLLTTVFLNPRRLLQTAGVVIAFVLASLGWDLAVWVANTVESAPNSS